MESLTYLQIAVGSAALVAALAFAYAVYHLTLTLKTLREVLEDIKDTTQDIQSVKNTLKFGLLNLAGRFLNTKTRRG